jgi:plasmid maintenance system antidote protein VapI
MCQWQRLIQPAPPSCIQSWKNSWPINTLTRPFLQEHSEGNMIRLFLLGLKKQGWTQEAIAEKIGVRQSQVSKLIQGGDCKASTVKKLADAFGVSTDTVLGYQPDNRRKGDDNYHAEERRQPEKQKTKTS